LKFTKNPFELKNKIIHLKPERDSSSPQQLTLCTFVVIDMIVTELLEQANSRLLIYGNIGFYILCL
jgi:hypothetical protein